MPDCSVAEAQDVGPHTEHHLYCRNVIATVCSYVILKRSDFRCINIHMTLRCVYMEVCTGWRYVQVGGMHRLEVCAGWRYACNIYTSS